jgi:hypothetical protein
VFFCCWVTWACSRKKDAFYNKEWFRVLALFIGTRNINTWHDVWRDSKMRFILFVVKTFHQNEGEVESLQHTFRGVTNYSGFLVNI